MVNIFESTNRSKQWLLKVYGFSPLWPGVTTCSHTASNGHLHHDTGKEIFQYGKGGQAIFSI